MKKDTSQNTLATLKAELTRLEELANTQQALIDRLEKAKTSLTLQRRRFLGRATLAVLTGGAAVLASKGNSQASINVSNTSGGLVGAVILPFGATPFTKTLTDKMGLITSCDDPNDDNKLSITPNTVLARSTNGYGVYGASISGSGIVGYNNISANVVYIGVAGISLTTSSNQLAGAKAYSNSGVGLVCQSQSGPALALYTLRNCPATGTKGTLCMTPDKLYVHDGTSFRALKFA